MPHNCFTTTNSVKERKIRAITLFKVIQGRRFWYKSTSY